MSKKSLPIKPRTCCLFLIACSSLFTSNVVHAVDQTASGTVTPENHVAPTTTPTPTGINPILQLPPAPEDVKRAQPTSPTNSSRTTTGLDTGSQVSIPTTQPTLTPTPPTLVAPSSQPTPTVRKETLRDIAHRLCVPLPLPDARIVITKSQRKLELFNGKTLVKTYNVSLGANPIGHKQNQGDGRTPEGQFYICTRNAKNSAFHIFLGLSYPALPDAVRGVNNKAITWKEYQIIRRRLASRGAPLWRTRLGGWVGIHGGTDGTFARRRMQERGNNDWTAGCIALTNAEIDEIYSATKLGTPVLVQP